ncbi:MAG: FAD-binding oxidoreductase [Blastocatellia bacterium]
MADAIDDLQREISGYVLRPNDAQYQQATEIDNGRVQLRPSLIVVANAAQDVAATLKFAQQHGQKLTIKGGGHSAAGYCLNTGGVVLDMSLMNSISLDKKRQTVKVQMGARWHDVYVFLMNSGTGLIPIGGGCPTVGIPGFMQGGGYSFVSRSYGMSIDNLLGFTIVTVDGQIHHVTAKSKSTAEKDLFWACRGGGGGNFGVIVDMELQVHQPRTAKMFTGQLRYPAARAQEVLSFYNDWVETLPNELAVYGIWQKVPDPNGSGKLTNLFGFTAIYNGDFAEGAELISPLLKFNPVYANLNNITLPEFELLNGASTLVNRRSAYIRAGIMPPKSFTPEAIEVYENYMASAPSDSSFIVWTHAGGKISEVAPDATGFFHREGRFVPELKAIWDTPQETRANVEWAYKFFRDLEPHFTGSYVNYIDPLLNDWTSKYYGMNYDRLVAIKRQLDPENFFHFQQSVGSLFEPQASLPLDLSPLNRTFVD